ncbi:MAG TPA: MASE3 domain-containing protein, partial [Negativicutes bacterium]|nr:MASE3 domain-containing protein [Negativicutes bacterium]
MNHLLFYSVINIFCAAIAAAIFLLTYTLRNLTTSAFFLIVGLGYGFVAILDLLHTLALQGLHTVGDGSAALTAQFGVAARAFDAGILFAGVFLCHRQTSFKWVILLQSIVFAAILFTFSFTLPPFTISVEYAAILIMVISIKILYQNRNLFSVAVFHDLLGAYVMTVIAALVLTLDTNINAPLCLVGHFFKLAAYLLFGQALLVHILREPLKTTFTVLETKKLELEVANLSLHQEISSHAVAEHELLKKNDMLSALADALAEMMSQANLSDLLDLLLVRTGQLIGCPNGFLYLVDANASAMTMLTATGTFRQYLSLRLQPGEGIAGTIWIKGKTVAIEDYSSWPHRMPGVERDTLKAVVGAPLKINERVEAIIGFANEDPNKKFSPMDIEFIERIASVGAIAIERFNLYHKLTEELAVRAKAEKDLEQSRNYYFSLYEQFPGMIWQALTVERQGLYFNERWLKFTGHSFPDELDSGWLEAVHPDDIELLMKTHRNAYSTRSGYETQYRLRRADDQYRWIAEIANPLYDFRGHFTGYMGGCFDVTDREELQQELATKNQKLQQVMQEIRQTQSKLIRQEKLAGIGQLAAGVAHEINNPLAFVNSNVNTLKHYMDSLLSLSSLCVEIAAVCMHSSDESCRAAGQRLLNAKKDFLLNEIIADFPDLFSETQNGLDRVKGIVDSLRGFSRIDQEAELAAYDLNAGILSTLTVAHNEYKYDAMVEKDLGEIPPFAAIGGQINQVLLNLIVNAAQAIRSQKRSELGIIRIKTFIEDNFAVCEISNGGPPIPAEIAAHLFEPFFTTKPVGEGTGLGLSISYDIIVNVHKGHISFTSDQTGTVFRLELPLGAR